MPGRGEGTRDVFSLAFLCLLLHQPCLLHLEPLTQTCLPWPLKPEWLHLLVSLRRTLAVLMILNLSGCEGCAQLLVSLVVDELT